MRDQITNGAQDVSNIGLIPDSGATWFLVRQVGYSRALEIAIEGERIPAERCLALGLANRLAEPQALLDEAQGWAEKLAQGPTYAIGLTKRAMQRAVSLIGSPRPIWVFAEARKRA